MWIRTLGLTVAAIAYGGASLVAALVLLVGLAGVGSLGGAQKLEPGWIGAFLQFGLLLWCVTAIVALPLTLLARWLLRRATKLSRRAFAGAGGVIGAVVFSVVAVLAQFEDEPGYLDSRTEMMILFGISGTVSIIAGALAGIVYRGLIRSMCQK